jgi:TolA-binding protein
LLFDLAEVRNSLLYCFLLSTVLATAQLNPFNNIKLAQGKLAKGKWQEGRSLLNKAIRKDSTQLQARYIYGLLFMNPRYPRNHVDSAQVYSQTAIRLYGKLTVRDKERLKKFPLDSLILTKLQSKIDSAAFEKAKAGNTEQSYIHFLKLYTTANQQQQAAELRDEAAFVDALKENKYNAFENFLKKYPSSHRSPEARQRYEKLFYEFSTRGKTLEEFKRFVAQYPDSPHKAEAIHHIFLMETEDGDPKSFEQFIRFYPNTPQSRRASAILFHQLSSQQQETMLNDSLDSMYPLKDWIPFHQETGWGFLDSSGTIKLTGLSELHEKYFCEPLIEDFILTEKNLVARNGAVISEVKWIEVQDIGSGFLLASDGQKSNILHKSGFQFRFPPGSQSSIINNRFVALQQKENWALFTLTGIQLTPFAFESFEIRGNILIANRAGKKLLVRLETLLAFAKGNHAPLVADEIKRYGTKYFWIRNGALEQIVDESLQVIIPYERQSITFNALGLVVKKNNQITLTNWESLSQTPLEHVDLIEPWLVAQKAGEKASLFFIPTQKLTEEQADSIWFDQSLAVVQRGDSIRLWRSGESFISLPKLENFKLKQSKDSSLFVVISGKTKSSVYEATQMKKIFSSNYQPEPILKNYFLFQEKGKQGLLDEKGKIVLKAEYDGVLYTNGIFNLLKNKQFGSFHPGTKKLIKPTFDSNLLSYNDQWLTARKKNQWGFLQLDGKSHTDFRFDEIEFWNDSLAFVKVAGKQSLYSITRKKSVLENISSLEKVESENGKVAIVRAQGFYGILNAYGTIILPTQYEEIAWQELNDIILFIALKPVDSDKCQVLYFSSAGKVLNSMITSKEAAFKLLCE